MPDCRSNIPCNIFYSCIAAISHIHDFLGSSKPLLIRMFKQGAKLESVSKVLLKCMEGILFHKGLHTA